MLNPRDRLIVALDVSSVAEAEALIAKLGEAVTFYKIGYQLGFAGGLVLAERLAPNGKPGVLDMELHHICNTGAHGVENAAPARGRLLHPRRPPPTHACRGA